VIVMSNSYDYVEVRLAEQRLAAEQRRRVSQARSHRGNAGRVGSYLRARLGRHTELGRISD